MYASAKYRSYSLDAKMMPCNYQRMEKLNEYLETHRANELAKAADCSPAMITMLKNGQRAPSFSLARKIREATGGFIGLDDWADVLA